MSALTLLSEQLAPSPMGFLRSNLFAAAERACKRDTKGNPTSMVSIDLDAAKHYNIVAKYEGPRLSQQHAMIFQALMREHRFRCGGKADAPLLMKQADLLRALGRTDTSTTARRWLWIRLKDLQKGIVDIKTTKHHYSGPLLGEFVKEEKSGAFLFTISARMTTFLSDELAMIDLDRKLSLGRHQLALWLHDFISTQSNVKEFPFRVDDLRRFSGSPLKLPQFRQTLQEAIALLKGGDKPLLINAHISPGGVLFYTKNPTKVVWIDERVTRRWETQNAIEDEGDRRRASKGRVAL